MHPLKKYTGISLWLYFFAEPQVSELPAAYGENANPSRKYFAIRDLIAFLTCAVSIRRIGKMKRRMRCILLFILVTRTGIEPVLPP